MSSNGFPRAFNYEIVRNICEDFVEYTMLILEVVERPLHFVIEVEVGGK